MDGSKGDLVAAAIKELRSRDLVYEGRLPPPKGAPSEDWEDREQTLFRSTEFGDDVDRPLKKSDGGYTYFASDIAYHKTKIDRGFLNLIDIWGADHGGYVKRMRAAVKALSLGKAELDVKLCQLVQLMRAGEPVKMSKRSGDFVTLREVVDEVGVDAARTTRRSNSTSPRSSNSRRIIRFFMSSTRTPGRNPSCGRRGPPFPAWICPRPRLPAPNSRASPTRANWR